MKKSGIFVLALVLASCSPADEPSVEQPAQVENFNTQHLVNMGFQVNSVTPADIDGLYEVLTDRGLVYTSTDGERIISGRIYDITGDKPVNLSEQILAQMRRSELAKVSDTVIEYKSPNEQHVVHVFTDTSCGYCRQFHERIDEYLANGITVRYLAWPRSGINGQASLEMQSVWCSENKQAALTAVKNDEVLPPASCDNPVAQHLALGYQFGVNGTPAIVLESGRMLPGYLPPQPLLDEVNKD